MSIKSTFSTLLAMSLLAPLGLMSQNAAPPAEVQEWVAEMQAIQARLEPIERQAAQDPALQQEHRELTTVVVAAMTEVDPEIQAKLGRLRDILSELHRGMNGGNGEDRLIAEAQELHAQVEAVKTNVLAQPGIEVRFRSYRDGLQARMIEIDPEARALMARFEELERRVTGLIQG